MHERRTASAGMNLPTRTPTRMEAIVSVEHVGDSGNACPKCQPLVRDLLAEVKENRSVLERRYYAWRDAELKATNWAYKAKESAPGMCRRCHVRRRSWVAQEIRDALGER